MYKPENSKILVVDDEPVNIFLLESILTEEEYQVITASNGYEALSIINETSIDAILLDIMMPEISGIEVLEKIKKNERIKDIPVIIISAKTEALDVKVALEKGAIDYIKKPIDSMEMLARLQTALNLKHKEDSLKQLLAFKDQVISFVSHNLRSPINNIIGYSTLLYNLEETDEQKRRFISQILENSERMYEFVNKLLNKAYLESGKITLKTKEIPVKRLIDRSVMPYCRKLEEKNLEIKINISDDIYIIADETLLLEVFNNLIENSIKYTPETGSIKISVYKEINRVIVEISDTGIGINKENIPGLFQAFNNHFTQGTLGEKGTGFGLSICKKIVDLHGFDIDVDSEKDKGTVFKVIIPQK
jgi:two-component system sensor histidine kinase/response regulator